MHRHLSVLLLSSALMMSSSAVAAPDNLVEKINILEQQIQELKALKEQQAVSAEKKDQCMNAFGREKFCSCVADGLSSGTTFEQYVHTLVTPKSKLGYDTMTTVQKKTVDDIISLRENCVEKGFFR